ncbi:MAG: ACP S-malonyltransferase [Candidatus Bipolaricaulaceae bacterium]
MVAFLFPGQGSHRPGMGERLLAAPWAEGLVREAEEACGLPLREIILERAEALEDTQVAQPAILLVERLACAALERAGRRPRAVAGHSLGEYAALAAANSLPWQEAFTVVAVRGRAMAEAARQQPGGMIALLGLSAEAAVQIAEQTGCHVANYNAPGQTVLSGELGALQRAAALARDRGGRPRRLPVAGAFHSPRVQEAESTLATYLQRVSIAPPKVTFVSSTTGQPEDDPERILCLLCRQMTSPVRWTSVLACLPQLGVREAVEAGPGQVLTRLGSTTCPEVRFRALGEVMGDV